MSAYFSDLPTLETERLLLRPIRRSDLLDMWNYAKEPGISAYTTWDYHREIGKTESYLNHVLENYSRGNAENWGLELKSSKRLIGMAGFGEAAFEHARGEIGYVISIPYWNMGLMTEAVRRVVQEGFTAMGLEKIVGRCISENRASKRILEKTGFSKEGHLRRQYVKNGTPHDIEVFGILRGEASEKNMDPGRI